MLKYLIWLAIFLFPRTVLAAEDAIASIEIEVELREDGSAVITEVWDIVNAYEGTEYYVVMNLFDEMNVHSLAVWDQVGTEFQIIDSWDVLQSLEAKAYKAGIKQTDDGVTLHWGMSRYGDHTFTVQYVMTNLVMEYLDTSGFYHQFVARYLSSVPNFVSLTLQMNHTVFSEENSLIELEGFKGEVVYTEDGKIRIYSEGSLSEQDSMIVMASFDTALFNPMITHQQDLLSASKTSLTGAALAIITLSVIGIVSLFSYIFYCFSLKLRLVDGSVVKKPQVKDTDIVMTTALPFRGGLPETYYAYNKLAPLKSSLLRTVAFQSYLMKWEVEGIISLNPIDIESDEAKVEIVFNDSLESLRSLTAVELALYELLRDVAKGEVVLATDQLQNWEEGPDEIIKWEKTLLELGESRLFSLGFLAYDPKGRIRFTLKGYDQLVKLVGYMKFLQEDEAPLDKHRWNVTDLIFATLLGLSKSVENYVELYSHELDHDFMAIYTTMSLSHQVNDSFVDHSSDSYMSDSGGGFSGGGDGGGSQ